jgi:hypothetical protein
VEFGVPYAINSLFELDPAPAAEMKYFGLAVRTLTSEMRFRVDGVSWTPQASNPSILFAGLDISGQLIGGNYGTPWNAATITFLPLPGSTNLMPEDVLIRDWTLVYQLVKQGLDPISNDWGCQWGIDESSNLSSSFIVGSDRVSVSPSSAAEVGVWFSGVTDSQQREHTRAGPNRGPTAYFPDVTASQGTQFGNEVVAFSAGNPPTLVTDVPWKKGIDKIVVPLRPSASIRISFVLLANAVGAKTRIENDFMYAARRWTTEKLGFSLVKGDTADRSQDPRAGEFADLIVKSSNCSALRQQIQAAFPAQSGEVTVYYVKTLKRLDASTNVLKTLAGMECPYSGDASNGQPLGGDFILLALDQSDVSALVHELGHALSLEHVEYVDERNVMAYPARLVGEYLTEGQTFRANFNPDSALIKTYGKTPPSGVRACTGRKTPGCPDLERRIWPDGALPAN